MQKLDVVQFQHEILGCQALHRRCPGPLGEKGEFTEVFARPKNAYWDSSDDDLKLPVEHEVHVCVRPLERVSLPHDELTFTKASSVLDRNVALLQILHPRFYV